MLRLGIEAGRTLSHAGGSQPTAQLSTAAGTCWAAVAAGSSTATQQRCLACRCAIRPGSTLAHSNSALAPSPPVA